MEFKPKGSVTLSILPENCAYGIPSAIKGSNGNNEGEANGSQFTLGPCLVEEVSMQDIRCMHYGEYEEILDQMVNPVVHRYILLDGQQLLYIEADNHAPLLLQTRHASFERQHGDNWRKLFPPEVYE